MYTYPGNIHIHSIHSDGTANIEEISREASIAGLSYIIVTDHMTLAGLNEESISHGVVVLVGQEVNKRYNHYLAFGTDQIINADDENPQKVIDQGVKAGALGFIAHPFEKGSRLIEKGKCYPWVNWPVFGFHGIELWNYTSNWRGLHPSFFKTLYYFFLNRKGALLKPSQEILQLWDCYNKNGYRIIGIGGSDAHAFKYNFGFFKFTIFPYHYIFNMINTYIVLAEKLSSSFPTAKKQIISAISEGRCYLAFDGLAKGEDFFFNAYSNREKVMMGGEIKWQRNLTLSVECPGKMPLLRIIRNGKVLSEKRTNRLYYPVHEPGIYRVEAYHCPLVGAARPWLYGNPIYVKP